MALINAPALRLFSCFQHSVLQKPDERGDPGARSHHDKRKLARRKMGRMCKQPDATSSAKQQSTGQSATKGALPDIEQSTIRTSIIPAATAMCKPTECRRTLASDGRQNSRLFRSVKRHRVRVPSRKAAATRSSQLVHTPRRRTRCTEAGDGELALLSPRPEPEALATAPSAAPVTAGLAPLSADAGYTSTSYSTTVAATAMRRDDVSGDDAME